MHLSEFFDNEKILKTFHSASTLKILPKRQLHGHGDELWATDQEYALAKTAASTEVHQPCIAAEAGMSSLTNATHLTVRAGINDR